MPEPLRQGDSPAAPQVGDRIRSLRQRTGLTLQQLADAAGISVGFLSQVERDKATPSLGTLAGLAAALGVEVEWFVATAKPTDAVTRAETRPRFAIGDGSLRYERLTTSLPGGILSSLIIHVPPGYASEVMCHPGEEVVVVLDGRLRKTLAGTELLLGPGDSLHFMGDTPHAFANVGETPARLLWTGTSTRLIGRSPEQP